MNTNKEIFEKSPFKGLPEYSAKNRKIFGSKMYKKCKNRRLAESELFYRLLITILISYGFEKLAISYKLLIKKIKIENWIDFKTSLLCRKMLKNRQNAIWFSKFLERNFY